MNGMLQETALRLLSDHVEKTVGLVIPAERHFLLESRLAPVVAQNAALDLLGLAKLVHEAPNGEVSQQICEALTTNETFFFRDPAVFDRLADTVLPLLRRQRGAEKVRIWCGAASTGQEPYSLAMLLLERPELGASWDIVATDVNASVLARARQARYHEHELQRGLSAARRERFFVSRGEERVLVPGAHGLIRFAVHNLLHDAPPQEQSDLVLLRNVLYYFEPKVRLGVLRRVAARLAPGGALVLGATEFLSELDTKSLGLARVQGDRIQYYLRQGHVS